MVKIKLELKKGNKIVFKLDLDDKLKSNILFKRALIESRINSGKVKYKYDVPLRFFFPIYKNINKENIILDKKSILSYYEFSDEYDERYYTEATITPKYMKKWREESCPEIYKISIDSVTKEVEKEVVFKKPKISLKGFEL